VKLKDGTEFMGILLRSSSSDVFRDLTGKERSFPEADIVSRTEFKTSLMPPGLVMSLTDAELRDLLAFLTTK
jgi:putative heme-binding domain-containing protein